MSWLRLWRRVETVLFPPIPEPNRSLPLWQYLLFIAVGVPLFAVIGSFLPANGFIGYDWVYYFSLGERGYGLDYYPPWMTLVRHLTWPGLIGLTFTGLALALYQRRASRLMMVAAFLSLPVFWVVFLGQLEGVVLFGLTGLPWLTPLATIKPQAAYLAFLARKEYLLGLLVWLLISMMIWGFWPLDMLQIKTYADIGEPHDISLWPWSIPLVLIMLWFSRGDVDMLMLAGTFLLPYLHPYHYFIVVPALARIRKWVAIGLIVISWLPLLANWFGPAAWYLGHLFPIILWLELYLKRRAWTRPKKFTYESLVSA